MTDTQYGAYGSDYSPQKQKLQAQYAYPKKKFPTQYVIIGVLVVVLVIIFGYMIMTKYPNTFAFTIII